MAEHISIGRVKVPTDIADTLDYFVRAGGLPHGPQRGKGTRLQGPFLFTGNLPDNGTTAVDLTASIADPQIRRWYGAGLTTAKTDPLCYLQMDAFKLVISAEAEVDASLIQDQLAATVLVWSAGKNEELVTVFDGYEYGAILAGTTVAGEVRSGGQGGFTPPKRLDGSWFIDLSQDAFELRFAGAVDHAAVIPFYLLAYGSIVGRAEGDAAQPYMRVGGRFDLADQGFDSKSKLALADRQRSMRGTIR